MGHRLFTGALVTGTVIAPGFSAHYRIGAYTASEAGDVTCTSSRVSADAEQVP